MDQLVFASDRVECLDQSWSPARLEGIQDRLDACGLLWVVLFQGNQVLIANLVSQEDLQVQVFAGIDALIFHDCVRVVAVRSLFGDEVSSVGALLGEERA